MRVIAAVLCWAMSCTLSLAGGRGGSTTAFDPAFFPGATVSCLTAAVAGKCTVAYNATCNGVADDSTPLRNWIVASIAANPTLAVLYIPPGSTCHFASLNNFVADSNVGGSGGFQTGDGIRKAVVWAYGATADAWGVSGEGFGQNTLTSARIVTASAGATTVTVVIAGDISKFSVGDWVAPTGIQLQNGGFPQNFHFFEFRLVKAINGTTLTLESPLVNSYKSTWPLYDQGGTGPVTITGAANNGSGLCRVTVTTDTTFTTGDKRGVSQIEGATGCNGNWTLTKVGDGTHIDLQGSAFGGSYTSGGTFSSADYGGPATIYKMGPSWNTNIQIYGLGYRPTTEGAESPHSGRNIAFYDNSWGNKTPTTSGAGPAPSMAKYIAYYGSYVSNFAASAGMEIDKQIENLAILNTRGNLFFQSSSPTNALVTGFRGNVSGTSRNVTFQNFVFPAVTQSTSIAVGPNCYGRGNALVFDGGSIASGSAVNCFILKTAFSYDSGTGSFLASNVSVTTNNLFPFFVPGGKYFFGRAFGSTTCNAGVTFTVTDITQTATDTVYQTDLVGALPTPSCNPGDGSAVYDRYVAYPASTITQRNTTGTDMTVFAPP